MSVREVLVEGPDDVAALNELSGRLWGTSVTRNVESQQARTSTRITKSKKTTIRTTVVPGAKAKIPEAVAALFRSLGPQIVADEARRERVAFLFDPDDDPANAFVDRVDSELRGLANASTPWVVQRSPVDCTCWTLQRGAEPTIELRGIAWRGSGQVLDGLKDHQSLDRLLSEVMIKAYPSQAKEIEAWLEAIRRFRTEAQTRRAEAQEAGLGTSIPVRALKWKAAVLLWAALVDESATTEAGIPSRFLGQHRHLLGGDHFKSHVEPVVDAAGLLEPLKWVFED